VEELAQLAGGPTGCGEVARGGCFICLELQCDKVNRKDGGGEKPLDQTCCRSVSDALLAHRLKIPPAKIRALHNAILEQFRGKFPTINNSVQYMPANA